jgi:hypothetical protein
MLNILTKGTSCIENVDVIVGGDRFVATRIKDTKDPHYLQKEFPFENETGISCNYFILGKIIKPDVSFSIPATTYGRDLQSEQPFFCFAEPTKTWTKCP